MYKPTFHSHTHYQAPQTNAQTQAWQRACLPHRSLETTGKKMDKREHGTGNMHLASCGVKWLNSSSLFQINFSAGLTVLCPDNPPERQAQKRYTPKHIDNWLTWLEKSTTVNR